MRWDRAAAYLDEIALDLGETPQRPEPELPEEKALREIMWQELNEIKAKRRKQHG